MSNFEQDEDYQVCDQCKETIYGEWVCYCWKCENDREKIIKSIGSVDHVWCVADVYDAAMAWEECCEEADNAPRTPDAMYRAGERVNKARERVREACRRAKEGR